MTTNTSLLDAIKPLLERGLSVKISAMHDRSRTIVSLWRGGQLLKEAEGPIQERTIVEWLQLSEKELCEDDDE